MRPAARLVLSCMIVFAGCGGGDPPKQTAYVPQEPPPAPTPTTPPSDPIPPATSEASATPPPSDDPAPLAFDGLKLTPTKAGKIKSVEIKSDGTISGDGKPIGTFSKNELRDAGGEAAYLVTKDGAVEGKQVNKKGSFNDKDEWVAEDGFKMTCGDDGTVKVEKPGAPKPETIPLKVEGVTSANRRAAILVAAYLVAPKGFTAGKPAGAGASSDATGAPKATPAKGEPKAPKPAPTK